MIIYTKYVFIVRLLHFNNAPNIPHGLVFGRAEQHPLLWVSLAKCDVGDVGSQPHHYATSRQNWCTNNAVMS